MIVSSLTERHIVTAPGFRQHLHFFFWTRDASFVLAVYLSDLLYEVEDIRNMLFLRLTFVLSYDFFLTTDFLSVFVFLRCMHLL